ncbi:unnamed protein product [Thelazia callipaeda]|uniref:Tyrosine-protein phosphatase domain-containing protein n=1 Tax=Thelazia callipaeda TaxID=103827 RepID=A0A0N5CPL7_THECL|nr:unnamed protein product [Thelazia callipaeda]
MVDTIQTKEGAVPISAEAMRSSMRSMRRGKNKNIPTPSSLVTHLRSNGRKLGDGIAEMYEQFEKESHTFFAFFNAENRSKNKFPNDIFLFDRTRVILVDPPDYYHASYVDGCQQVILNINTCYLYQLLLLLLLL